MAEAEATDFTAQTVQLLSAYLANNTVAPTELAELIRSTRAVLGEGPTAELPEVLEEAHVPAVSVRKSLASPEHIVSLIDGKLYKTLKRHIAKHGLTPASYRARYKLSDSYPMVAPGFAAKRREIAAAIGLGRKSKAETTALTPAPAPAPAPSIAATPDVHKAQSRPMRGSGRKTKSARSIDKAKVSEEQKASEPAAATVIDENVTSTTDNAPKKAKRMVRAPAPVVEQTSVSEAVPVKAAATKRAASGKKVPTPAKGRKAKAAVELNATPPLPAAVAPVDSEKSVKAESSAARTTGKLRLKV